MQERVARVPDSYRTCEYRHCPGNVHDGSYRSPVQGAVRVLLQRGKGRQKEQLRSERRIIGRGGESIDIREKARLTSWMWRL